MSFIVGRWSPGLRTPLLMAPRRSAAIRGAPWSSGTGLQSTVVAMASRSMGRLGHAGAEGASGALVGFGDPGGVDAQSGGASTAVAEAGQVTGTARRGEASERQQTA
jgi:hypothetical protein